jgi:molecular chaperone DnaJ
MSVNREWLEKDYYAVLGVGKSASQAEIKKAYRRLAQKHHPDANRGDKAAEDRFKEVSAAYDVLGDESKRKEYDRIREMATAGVRFGGGPGGAGGFRFEDFGFDAGGGIGDIFDLFGGGGRRGRQTTRRGSDVETEIQIPFEDAITGTTVPLTLSGAAPCDTCNGSGAEPGTQPQVCPQCGGTGSIAVDQGYFSLSRGCPRCGGSGRIIEKPCRTCRGSGQVRKTRNLSVKIPRGIEDGARIRLTGRGEAGPPGGRPGDLYVNVRVAPHQFFGRRGPDLTLDLPITFPEAALGANVKVPTLNGAVTLKIPSGTSPGRTFRVRGRGAPKRGGGNGDLLVTVQVEVPSRLSKEERELLERFSEKHRTSPRARLGVTDEEVNR